MDIKQDVKNTLDAIDTELTKLKTAVGHIAEAKDAAKSVTDSVGHLHKVYTDHIDVMRSVNDSYTEQAEKAEDLTERIDKVNFPERLDKVDISVSSINQALQNVQARLESATQGLKETVQDGNRRILGEIADQTKLIKQVRLLLFFLAAVAVATGWFLWHKL